MVLRIKRSRVPWTRSVGFAIMPRLPTIVDDQQIIAQAGLLTDQPAGIREDDPGSILIVPEKNQGGPAWRVRLPEIGWIVEPEVGQKRGFPVALHACPRRIWLRVRASRDHQTEAEHRFL